MYYPPTPPAHTHIPIDVCSLLNQVSMLATVKELGDGKGLDAPIQEGGSNLSAGERQLLGLARAILRDTRILVRILDSETCSVPDVSWEGLCILTISSAEAQQQKT